MYNNNINNNNNNKCIKLLVINLLSYLSDDNRKCRQHITFLEMKSQVSGLELAAWFFIH